MELVAAHTRKCVMWEVQVQETVETTHSFSNHYERTKLEERKTKEAATMETKPGRIGCSERRNHLPEDWNFTR
jgi:hypothetical protein